MLKKVLKKISAFIQTKTGSYRRHNLQYVQPGHLDRERATAEKYRKEGLFNQPCQRYGLLLEKFPQVRKHAVDIGSGAGWLSAELSKHFESVYAIEPSEKAVEIAQVLYPASSHSNIRWMVGFSEEVLPRLGLGQPAAFFTGCVLSHLRDREVAKICEAVDKIALPGSILAFSECWGGDWHQLMWHVRTKEWWQERFPGWELDFHGPEIQGVPGRHMGFHGIKKS